MNYDSARLISILYRKSQMFLGQALREFGITSGEYPVILYLCKEDGVTQEQITEYLDMDKSAIARVIQSLQEKELIDKRKDERDKRCNRIYLTDKGRASEKNIRGNLREWNLRIHKGMKEEETEELNRLLLFMVENSKEKNILGDEDGRKNEE